MTKTMSGRLGASFPWRWLALTCLFWALAGPALAQRVLILQADESTSDDSVGAANIQTNLYNEFVAAGATVTVNSGLAASGSVSASTFTAAPGPYDLVVVLTVYLTADAGNIAAIQAAVASRAAKAFVMFMDGYVPASVTQFVGLVNGVTGAGVSSGASVGVARFPLNTLSPHQGSFAGMPEIHGGIAMYVDGVAPANALYLQAGATPPAAGAPPQTAYAVFYPQGQVNGGQGACLLGMTDGTQFYSGDSNNFYSTIQNKMAPALFAALLSPGGACGVPPASVTKSFAPATVALGGTATLTITLNNLSNPPQALTGAQVQDALPAPLLVAGTASHTCTGGTLTADAGSASVALTGATIPTGGCSVTVPVAWPSTAAGQAACPAGDPSSVTNTITPPAGFSTDQDQEATPATATLSCDPALPPVVAPGDSLATVAKSFSPAAVAPGGTATLTLTLSNLSDPSRPLAGAQVQDTLPAPLRVAGAATHTCTGGTLTAEAGAASVGLAGATIPVGGCSVTVPVAWPDDSAGLAACPAGASTSVTNTITPAEIFSTDPRAPAATATLSCTHPAPPVVRVTPVPTLGEWASAALAALTLLAGLGALRRRASAG